MAGKTVEICRDDLQEVLRAGGRRMKDGFNLVPYAVRPHNQNPTSQAAGSEFERKMRARQVTDDEQKPIVNCPVLYMNDGHACLFVGTTKIRLPDPNVKREIAEHR